MSCERSSAVRMHRSTPRRRCGASIGERPDRLRDDNSRGKVENVRGDSWAKKKGWHIATPSNYEEFWLRGLATDAITACGLGLHERSGCGCHSPPSVYSEADKPRAVRLTFRGSCRASNAFHRSCFTRSWMARVSPARANRWTPAVALARGAPGPATRSRCRRHDRGRSRSSRPPASR